MKVKVTAPVNERFIKPDKYNSDKNTCIVTVQDTVTQELFVLYAQEGDAAWVAKVGDELEVELSKPAEGKNRGVVKLPSKKPPFAGYGRRKFTKPSKKEASEASAYLVSLYTAFKKKHDLSDEVATQFAIAIFEKIC